jgi:hypothetical protein
LPFAHELLSWHKPEGHREIAEWLADETLVYEHIFTTSEGAVEAFLRTSNFPPTCSLRVLIYGLALFGFRSSLDQFVGSQDVGPARLECAR